MIDTFALCLGHGLLAIALMRLAMRDTVDKDPLTGAITDEARASRDAGSAAGRNAARRAQTAGGAPGARKDPA